MCSILTKLRSSVSRGANPMSEAEMDAHTIRCVMLVDNVVGNDKEMMCI
jgi:hypothetical protein